MTLAVAAEFPWGEHRRILDSFPFRTEIEGAIILAADSRWTSDDGTSRDDGRKLWLLGKHLGIVFAGDVWAAEEGFRRLRKAGRNATFRHARDVVTLAAEVFSETYSAHWTSSQRGVRGIVDPVHYLLGFVDTKGSTALVRLSSEGGFRPLYLRGVHAVGISSVCSQVENDLVARTKEVGFQSDDYMTWALNVVDAIDSRIQDNSQPRIGGRVQWVVGTKRGWEQLGASTLEGDGDFLVNDNWREATSRLEDLHSIASKFGEKWLATPETNDLVTDQIDI